MQPARRRILCADDHDDTRSMLTALLGQKGYEVISTGRAGEALELARRERFDLYILDVRLPDGSGLELCASLRAHDPAAEVFFYSGAAYERDRLAGLSLGAAAYVIKPGVEELTETVVGLLEGAGSVPP
jgi:DNA-binding response OmpR family regulator